MPSGADERDDVRQRAVRARAAALVLQALSDERRRAAVRAMAEALHQNAAEIERANRRDVEAAEQDRLAAPVVERLGLGGDRLARLLDGVRTVADLPDPLGRTLRATRLDDGLRLFQVTVPIGVLGVVFESRPDALVQIAALALRSGNVVLLKGGQEAAETNRFLAEVIRRSLQASGLPEDSVVLLHGRSEVDELLRLDDLVDLLIPRGSSGFVRHVMDNTRIPVLGHAEGVCHVYVDAAADLEKAQAIVRDAKADHPAACNAAETVLVHRDVAKRFLPMLETAAKEAHITLRRDDGFGVEHGDLTLSIGVVDDMGAALAHIARYGSRHTEAIVTEDEAAARRFVAGVDAASVMVNASTRFADGYRYGLGAEVGISTSKIHARGPVGLEGLTTTKWVVLGSGQTAGAYQGPAARPFEHAALRTTIDSAWGQRKDA